MKKFRDLPGGAAIAIGAVLAAFGLFCLAAPSTAARVLSVVGGAGIILTGALAVVEGAPKGAGRYRWLYFVEAGLHLGLGLTLLLGRKDPSSLGGVAAVWAVVFGVFRIVRAASRESGGVALLLPGLAFAAAGVLLLLFLGRLGSSVPVVLGLLLVFAAAALAWTGASKRKKKAAGPEGPGGE